eukprot:s126_g29.t2
MSLVDSTAVFDTRARTIGIPDATLNQMNLRGWTTHATFAFSVATQPGLDEQAFIDGVVVPILGQPDHIDAPKLRRLFFESHTLTAADLRRKVDSTELEAPRKLPAPEIAQRLELLQQRINPLIIANVLEPSHQLINSLVQCVEDGRVRYIEWSRCTSRTQEVNNVKEDGDLRVWKTDGAGNIKAVNKEPSISANLATELDVHNALRRRGVAYEIAQAMSFEVHEKLINFYFFELKKEPMEGFSAVTLVQVAAADRELHIRLAEATRAGFRPGPAGELPLDIPTETILNGPELRWMLMPLPKKNVSKAPETSLSTKPAADTESKRTRNENTKKTKEEALKLKKLKRTLMPKKLVGCVPCTEEGQPFCFGYNLGTCKSSNDCEKGRKDVSTVMSPRKRGSIAISDVSHQLDGSMMRQKSRKIGPDGAEGPPMALSPEVGHWQQSASQPHQKVDGDTFSHVEAQPKRNLFILDLFCGTAGVTAALKSMGCDALGIDHMVDKRRVKGPVAKVDLSKKSGQSTVLSWILEGKVDGVMLAPPCGTSSRAREIPLPKRLRLRSGMQPTPLRSDKFPMGLPTLRGVAKLKVQTANLLYSFTREVIEACLQRGIPFICENPRRSLMWSTDPFSGLPDSCFFQYIHACMYGSKRRKSTAFLMNFSAPSLRAECDGEHQHLPWGMVDAQDGQGLKFSTSLETEYPSLLCKHIAIAFLEFLKSTGKVVSEESAWDDQLQKIGAGVQPRGGRSPLILGEFKFKIDVTSSNVPVPAHISADVPPPFQGVPLDAKLISSREEVQKGENGEKICLQRSTFGVYFSPLEFLRRATQLEHPLDTPQLVDRSNLRAILFIRDNSPAHVAKFRVEQLKRFSKRALELSADEAALKRSLDPDVEKILHSKRLLLFKEMADEAGVGDDNLFAELKSGFTLTGAMPESGQFPAKLKPAMISVQQLRESSVWAKRMIHASCKRIANDEEIACAVYEETLQQLNDGWVKGPFTEEQLDKKFDGCWIPSKRFGVRQGQKIRAVDDFSEFLINSSVSSVEKLQLFGIDEVVNTARTFLGCHYIQVDEAMSALSCNSALFEPLKYWKRLRGRALDLKSAYKQLARSPQDAWASILAVWNVKLQKVEFFESVALPFGSVCAVMAFNRMARALRLILAELFMIVNTNFFDDFCQLETTELCSSAWSTAELVMQLLGWRISTSDDKRLPFADEFQMLGAVVDLSRSADGIIRVKNKESRIKDISALVDEVCSRDTIPLSIFETLKGRLLYAAGHTFGRCTQLAIQLISRLARRGPLVLLDDNFKAVIRDAFGFLATSPPREVWAWSGRPPVIVFTDCACEEDGSVVTHGGALFDPESGLALMFGDHVPEAWTQRWRLQGKKQLICQAEIFPVLVSKETWKSELSKRAVLWFIDNNSALSAIIRAFSPVFENYQLLVINARLDLELQCQNWYSRVPSKSNLSDDPSRLSFQQLADHGFKRCTPQYTCLTTLLNLAVVVLVVVVLVVAVKVVVVKVVVVLVVVVMVVVVKAVFVLGVVVPVVVVIALVVIVVVVMVVVVKVVVVMVVVVMVVVVMVVVVLAEVVLAVVVMVVVVMVVVVLVVVVVVLMVVVVEVVVVMVVVVMVVVVMVVVLKAAVVVMVVVGMVVVVMVVVVMVVVVTVVVVMVVVVTVVVVIVVVVLVVVVMVVVVMGVVVMAVVVIVVVVLAVVVLAVVVIVVVVMVVLVIVVLVMVVALMVVVVLAVVGMVVVVKVVAVVVVVLMVMVVMAVVVMVVLVLVVVLLVVVLAVVGEVVAVKVVVVMVVVVIVAVVIVLVLMVVVVEVVVVLVVVLLVVVVIVVVVEVVVVMVVVVMVVVVMVVVVLAEVVLAVVVMVVVLVVVVMVVVVKAAVVVMVVVGMVVIVLVVVLMVVVVMVVVVAVVVIVVVVIVAVVIVVASFLSVCYTEV